jgi:hypothetical protein
MDGYKVVTSDGEQVGHVVGEVDGNLIVESGHLRKTRHAIPKAFAHVDDEHETVTVTVSKNVIEESPKVNGGLDDPGEVARFYGLAGGFETSEGEEAGDIGTVAAERGRMAIMKGEGEEDAPAEVHGRTPTADDPAGLSASDPR